MRNNAKKNNKSHTHTHTQKCENMKGIQNIEIEIERKKNAK